MHTAEPLVPEPGSSQVDIAIEELKRFVTPGFDQIPAEMIKAGSNRLRSESHKLINSISMKGELPQQWKGSIIVQIYKKR
jgi:hypothetical protein